MARTKTNDLKKGSKMNPIPQSKPDFENEASVSQIESDREFKAHIYQQLAELQPFLSEESQISVAIKFLKKSENQDHKRQLYASPTESDHDCSLTLITQMGAFRLEAEGRHSDHYQALSIAKQKMLWQLNEILGASIDSRARNAQIRAIRKGEFILH